MGQPGGTAACHRPGAFPRVKSDERPIGAARAEDGAVYCPLEHLQTHASRGSNRPIDSGRRSADEQLLPVSGPAAEILPARYRMGRARRSPSFNTMMCTCFDVCVSARRTAASASNNLRPYYPDLVDARLLTP